MSNSHCINFSFPRFLFILVLSTFIISSCKTTRKVEKPVVIKTNRQFEEKGAEVLLKNIMDSAFYGRWINAKANVTAKVGDETNSFNINMRMCRDSSIWVSVTPLLGIEAVRVLLTPDSVKFLDRIHREYKITGYKFINDLLHLSNLDFDVVQGILIGNLFAFRKNKFNSVYLEDQQYILSTLSKRKLKRSLEEKDPSKPVIQDFYVDGNSYHITKLYIEDNRGANKTLLTEYSDFQMTNEGVFPHQSKTIIKAEKDIQIDIEYSKISIDDTLDFPFSVPKSYREIRQ